MAEFKHTQSKKFPALIRKMHPDKSCIPKQVEDVNDWYGKEQGANTALSINIEH